MITGAYRVDVQATGLIGMEGASAAALGTRAFQQRLLRDDALQRHGRA